MQDDAGGDQTDSPESKTPDAVALENDVSTAGKDDDPRTIKTKENGIPWLGNPKILYYPEGIPETRGRQHVKKMFQCHAEREDDWDYQDALKKFREMYPRAVTGDPRDPWRKKDVKPCPNT